MLNCDLESREPPRTAVVTAWSDLGFVTATVRLGASNRFIERAATTHTGADVLALARRQEGPRSGRREKLRAVSR